MCTMMKMESENEITGILISLLKHQCDITDTLIKYLQSTLIISRYHYLIHLKKQFIQEGLLFN